MNECKRFRDMAVEALYDELSAQDSGWFQQHLSACGKCAAGYRKMKETAAVMSRRETHDPGEEFWNSYYSNVAARLQKAQNEQKAVKVIPYSRSLPWWASRVAAAVILLLLGVLLGEIFLRKSNVPVVTNPGKAVPSPKEVQMAKLENRTQDFLSNSEVLVLGIVNSKTAEDSPDMSGPKKASGKLMQEAAYLKEELSEPDQKRLRRLVEDLEVILLQISNLEAKHDVPEIELVKSGVERKAILLKINLELMKMADAEQQPAEKNRGKNTPRSDEL